MSVIGGLAVNKDNTELEVILRAMSDEYQRSLNLMGQLYEVLAPIIISTPCSPVEDLKLPQQQTKLNEMLYRKLNNMFDINKSLTELYDSLRLL